MILQKNDALKTSLHRNLLAMLLIFRASVDLNRINYGVGVKDVLIAVLNLVLVCPKKFTKLDACIINTLLPKRTNIKNYVECIARINYQ